MFSKMFVRAFCNDHGPRGSHARSGRVDDTDARAMGRARRRMTRRGRARVSRRWIAVLVAVSAVVSLVSARAEESSSSSTSVDASASTEGDASATKKDDADEALTRGIRAFERWVRAPATLGGDEAEVSGSVRVLARTAGAGRGVGVTANVSVGELLLSMPLEKCVSTASARADPGIGAAIAGLEATTESILSLHLLHEAFGRGAKSSYFPWIRLLPRSVDSTIGWSEEELAELEGSNLFTFTKVMKESWSSEYATLDLPSLGEKFPDVFGGDHAENYSFDKFIWAMFVVWSRAIDLETGSKEAPTTRVLVPFLDMANHAPQGKLRPEWDATSNSIKVYAASAFRERTELRFAYGEKPSQYFLLQYGFIPENNPHECVEVTVHINENDPSRDKKEEILRKHGLDPRTRNFEWKPKGLDYDLLAATRIIVMDDEEIQDDTTVTLAVSGASASAVNDARTKAVLLKSISSFLEAYPTTLGEDNLYVARVNNATAEELPGKRKRFAVLLRMREKQILLASANTIFKELPDEDSALVDDACNRFFKDELEKCAKRANGTMFAAYERASLST